MEWIWNQKNEGKPALPGLFTARLVTENAGNPFFIIQDRMKNDENFTCLSIDTL